MSIAFAAMFALFAAAAIAESNRTFKFPEARNGSLTVDGRAITLADLDATFRDIAKQHGHVAYYREESDESPDAKTVEILRAGEKYTTLSFGHNRF